jgi:hypothetical protein
MTPPFGTMPQYRIAISLTVAALVRLVSSRLNSNHAVARSLSRATPKKRTASCAVQFPVHPILTNVTGAVKHLHVMAVVTTMRYYFR